MRLPFSRKPDVSPYATPGDGSLGDGPRRKGPPMRARLLTVAGIILLVAGLFSAYDTAQHNAVIDELNATDEPTEQPTATPAPTPTPTPVMTIGPSGIPTMAPTPEPTPTPYPIEKPDAGSIPGPTSTDSIPPVLSAHAPSRVVYKDLDIDLGVFRPRDDETFPPCGIAEYLPFFSDPSQGSVTYLYAHAREGMFLPILLASKKKNGASMIGDRIDVYTKDDLRYTYEVVAVYRHVKDWDVALHFPRPALVMQTSEGHGSDPKMQIFATQVGDPVPVDHDVANVKNRKYSCR